MKKYYEENTPNEERTPISVNTTLQERQRIKSFCAKRGLKMNAFCRVTILEHIDAVEEKEGKKSKKTR